MMEVSASDTAGSMTRAPSTRSDNAFSSSHLRTATATNGASLVKLSFSSSRSDAASSILSPSRTITIGSHCTIVTLSSGLVFVLFLWKY